MGNISFKHEEVEGATKKLEDAAKAGNGVALGTLSITVHEEHDARDERDAAIEGAGAMLKVIGKMRETEDKLRAQLKSSSDGFHKERSERTAESLKYLGEISGLKAEVQKLSAENAALKDKLRAGGSKPRAGRRKKAR